jgi:type III restriction enzyme
MFLYEQLDAMRSAGFIPELPKYIQNNLNPKFELRQYQSEAFENFVAYFENTKLCAKPTQTLFHMATGSGKTLIMAGLILYLYKKGYRNFLFFVHRTQIVKKTKENFLNSLSSKYLFSEEIEIDGEHIPIREVLNFQSSDPNSINICFTTIQGLSSDIWNVKENGISIDDFIGKKVVLISDEAHHLNADTKNPSEEDVENYHSWESTVKYIHNSCRDNVLLEFTATCDLQNPLIKAEYTNKIIVDYPLYKFRADRYSKEIKTFRSDGTAMDKALQAIILSQYRMKVFAQNRLFVKPVVLFKSPKVAKSKKFQEDFHDSIAHLSSDRIKNIAESTTSNTLKSVFAYFEKKEISYDQLVREIKNDFGPMHCICANDDSDIEQKQIILNSLEDATNPYRAVFEVEKLDEGWDVLNLFDIVRIDDKRQSGGKKISKTTLSEAQLIGRGARYCPFQLKSDDEKYRRKFDSDIDNPLRICEELYYHCQNDSKYITELHQALKEIGLGDDDIVTRKYVLKQDFKDDELYKSGIVFINDRELCSRNSVYGIPQFLKDKEYSFSIDTGRTGEDTIMDKGESTDSKNEVYTTRYSISQIAQYNYAIVYKALCKYPILKFNLLKQYYPHLASSRDFIMDSAYLGDIKIAITSRKSVPTNAMLLTACTKVIGAIAEHISGIEETYKGTHNFTLKNIRDIFKDKTCQYTRPHDGGVGISQNDPSVPSAYKLDLSREDWFAFEDNFGTSEEKAFIAYFKTFIPQIRAKYDKVYLVRNERQLHIYSFDEGGRFEPDYVLFLQKQKSIGFEQLQIFIEPKGAHLISDDLWKERFLLQMESTAAALKKFVDDNDYRIWGFHFFNQTERPSEFADDMRKII